MLTKCLAIADSMIFKFSRLLLQTTPLWILGLQDVAVAQVSVPLDTSTSVLTSIESATSDTSVVQQGNQFKIMGGQSSGGTDPNLVHQFHTFELGSGDSANFIVDPNVANVISLIDSLQPSVIDGLLKLTSSNPSLASNANLFLVNPAGVIFGQNATLNIPANLTATAGAGLLFDDEYLLSVDGSVSAIALPDSGPTDVPSFNTNSPSISNLTGAPNGYLLLTESASTAELNPFSPALPQGSIENKGRLQVEPHASITLVGQYIQNDGTLVAPGGSINLVTASGENLLRLNHPDSVLSLDLIPTDTISVLSSVTQQSALTTTDMASLLTGGNEQNATQIEMHADGTQSLTSPPPLTPTPGSLIVRGTLDVSNNADQTAHSPGQVTLIGEQINLVGGNIYADGTSQAGTISVGGMPSVDGFNATYVVIDRDSQLSADASQGTGGVVDVWADDTVWFYGEATAAGSSPELDGSISISGGNGVDIR